MCIVNFLVIRAGEECKLAKDFCARGTKCDIANNTCGKFGLIFKIFVLYISRSNYINKMMHGTFFEYNSTWC